MSIRSAARGLVVDGNRVLLEKCVSHEGVAMYILPGGGQDQYEPILDSVARETLEESGYRVKPTRLVAVCEQIFEDAKVRENYPDHAHTLHHIFLCELLSRDRAAPTELDFGQEGTVWMPIAEADRLDNLFPITLRGRICALTQTQTCEFLGTEYILPI